MSKNVDFKMTDEFSKKHDDMVGHILLQMLYSLGDEIGKINDEQA